MGQRQRAGELTAAPDHTQPAACTQFLVRFTLIRAVCAHQCLLTMVLPSGLTQALLLLILLPLSCRAPWTRPPLTEPLNPGAPPRPWTRPSPTEPLINSGAPLRRWTPPSCPPALLLPEQVSMLDDKVWRVLAEMPAPEALAAIGEAADALDKPGSHVRNINALFMVSRHTASHCGCLGSFWCGRPAPRLLDVRRLACGCGCVRCDACADIYVQGKQSVGVWRA